MGLFTRAQPVPPELAGELGPDERVLAVGDTEVSVVVATNRGLWLPTSASQWRLIVWSDVVKATWSASGLTVVAGTADDDGVVTDEAPVVVALNVPRNLPAVTRTRVEASIARSEQVVVPGGVARVVGRRVPGRDGVQWTGRFDTGTPDSPAARASLISKIEGMMAADTPQ